MNTLRVGIVGCGEAAQILHLPSLYQLGEKFRVTALGDVSRTVLAAVGDAAGVSKRFLDYRELVVQPDVDVVLITSPHAYHAEVALAAIAAGKHVFVEKPMCLTPAEADAIIAAQRAKGVIVQVGYMRRHAPAFAQACRMVQEIGPIRLAHVRDVIGKNALIINQTSRVVRGSDIPAAVIEQGQALQAERLAEVLGDAPADLQRAYMLMLGLSSHDLSAMRELLGQPRRVLYAAKRQGGIYLTAAFDYGDFVCQFDTGVDNIPRFDAHLEVFGAEKTLKVVYDTPYVRNLPIRLLVKAATAAGGVQEEAILPAWGDPFVLEWEAFHASVESGQPPKTGPEDFRQDLELFGEMVALIREPVPA